MVLVHHQRRDLPLGSSDVSFLANDYSSNTAPFEGTGHVVVKCFWRGGYGRISGGLRVLDLVADIREASPWKGARYSLTNMLMSS
jgi:hypothetical protein